MTLGHLSQEGKGFLFCTCEVFPSVGLEMQLLGEDSKRGSRLVWRPAALSMVLICSWKAEQRGSPHLLWNKSPSPPRAS